MRRSLRPSCSAAVRFGLCALSSREALGGTRCGKVGAALIVSAGSRHSTYTLVLDVARLGVRPYIANAALLKSNPAPRCCSPTQREPGTALLDLNACDPLRACRSSRAQVYDYKDRRWSYSTSEHQGSCGRSGLQSVHAISELRNTLVVHSRIPDCCST